MSNESAPTEFQANHDAVNAARDAVIEHDGQYDVYQPSQQALARGAERGRTELIGDPLDASINTNKGTLPDYHRDGPTAQPSYNITNARLRSNRPAGTDKVVEFNVHPNSETGQLEVGFTKAVNGEVTHKNDRAQDLAPGIGTRVISLASQRIINQTQPNKLRNV